jgi:hypothetical protein
VIRAWYGTNNSFILSLSPFGFLKAIDSFTLLQRSIAQGTWRLPPATQPPSQAAA